MSFSLIEYERYKKAGRKIVLSKEGARVFFQLQTFNSWTGVEEAPEFQEVDLVLLQQEIDALAESLNALFLLQEDLLAL